VRHAQIVTPCDPPRQSFDPANTPPPDSIDGMLNTHSNDELQITNRITDYGYRPAPASDANIDGKVDLTDLSDVLNNSALANAAPPDHR
jgi:hypothetical protein